MLASLKQKQVSEDLFRIGAFHADTVFMFVKKTEWIRMFCMVLSFSSGISSKSDFPTVTSVAGKADASTTGAKM